MTLAHKREVIILKVAYNRQFYTAPLKFALKPGNSFNKNIISFGKIPDEFIMSDTAKYLNIAAINNMISPEVRRFARIAGIDKLKPSARILEDYKNGHLLNVYKTAIGIYNNLTPELQAKANLQVIKKAALLHDISKIVMPESIIYNRSPHLSKTAWGKMKMHTILSDEMLKAAGMDLEIRNLAKYHHQNLKGTGYPAIEGDFKFTINHEILALADRYSGAREKRSYKEAKVMKNALESVKEWFIDTGELGLECYQGLAKYVKSELNSPIANTQREVINFKPVDSFGAVLSKSSQGPTLDLIG